MLIITRLCYALDETLRHLKFQLIYGRSLIGLRSFIFIMRIVKSFSHCFFFLFNIYIYTHAWKKNMVTDWYYPVVSANVTSSTPNQYYCFEDSIKMIFSSPLDRVPRIIFQVK